MSRYTPAILKMGILVPGAMNAVILGAVLYGSFWFSGEKLARDKRYHEHMDRLSKSTAMDAELAPRRPRFKEEIKCLTKDLRQELASSFSKATEHYKDFELQQASVSFPITKGGLDAQAEGDKSHMQTLFKGGYGPMEEALFRVESRLPQLLMEKMNISREHDTLNSDGEHLAFTIDLMGWSLSPSKR